MAIYFVLVNFGTEEMGSDMAEASHLDGRHPRGIESEVGFLLRHVPPVARPAKLREVRLYEGHPGGRERWALSSMH